MGVSYTASLFVGVDYKDIIWEEYTPYEEVTKYHPDTGQPYQIKQRKLITTMFGKPVKDKYEAQQYLENIGLDFAGFGGYNEKEYIGKHIGDTEAGHEEKFTTEYLQEVQNEVLTILRNEGYDGEIKVILGLNVSC